MTANDPIIGKAVSDRIADNNHGAELLDDLRAFLTRFVVYPEARDLVAHVLWIAHTWFMDCWESTPRIAFLSPEPGSGKSRALEVTEPLVPRPVHAVNTTPAYLFRKVSDEAGRPTILYDEIDTVFGPKANGNEDIRGMLNAGHRKGAMAGRCVVRGKIVETEELPAYCAVALAGLNDLPDTVMTRAVVIRMKRRSPLEKVEPWRPRVSGPDAEKLRVRLEQWAVNAAGAIVGWPDMPVGVEDRNADVWEALLAVADLAGDHWPETARAAAVAAVADSMAGAPSIGVQLLDDIRVIFRKVGTDRLSSGCVLTQLKEIEESPWESINRDGSALKPRGLAQRLSRYGIKSGNMRGDDGKVFKGYFRHQFVDVWIRYLPDEAVDDDTTVGEAHYESATAATNGEPQVNGYEPEPFANCRVCDFDGLPPGRTMHHDCERVAAGKQSNGHQAPEWETA